MGLTQRATSRHSVESQPILPRAQVGGNLHLGLTEVLRILQAILQVKRPARPWTITSRGTGPHSSLAHSLVRLQVRRTQEIGKMRQVNENRDSLIPVPMADLSRSILRRRREMSQRSETHCQLDLVRLLASQPSRTTDRKSTLLLDPQRKRILRNGRAVHVILRRRAGRHSVESPILPRPYRATTPEPTPFR